MKKGVKSEKRNSWIITEKAKHWGCSYIKAQNQERNVTELYLVTNWASGNEHNYTWATYLRGDWIPDNNEN